jgi:leader peptidase (prepilin peptidase)/N-methyltransferase
MLPPGFAEVLVVLCGLCIGSFLNVCIHRLPIKQSVVSPPSRCPDCGNLLRWFDNVPIVSYAVLRGRCRACGKPISLRYPIVEAVTAALFLLHWWVLGPTPLFAVRLAFACALLVLFMIDLEYQILPDAITLPGIVAGFACSWFLPPGPLMSGLGILFGGGLLWAIAEVWLRLRKVDAMGFGDVKMLAMIGAVLGVKLMVLTFVLSSMIGGVVAGAMMATRRADLATRVPYGTMLAVAALIASLYGEALIAWYLTNL